MVEVFCFSKEKFDIYLIHSRNFFESVSLILNKIPFESLAVKILKCDCNRIFFTASKNYSIKVLNNC